MTHEEIAQIKLIDTMDKIFPLIINVDVIGPEYTLDADQGKDWYERIYMNPVLPKPSRERFQEEFDQYIDALTKIEDERLAAEAKAKRDADSAFRLDMTTRFAALKNMRACSDKAGFIISNLTIKMRDDIEAMDTGYLELIEAEALVVDEKEAREASLRHKMSIGGKAQAICDEVLGLIAGHNVYNRLTDIQIDQLENDNLPIIRAIANKRPKKVKRLIEAMIPDGTIVTQDLKNDILYLFSKYGL